MTAKNKRIVVFGCKHTTLDLITGLLRSGINIDYCVTLTPDLAKKESVSGYYDLRLPLKSLNIPCANVDKYSLMSNHDRDIIGSLNIDLILCMGWQRLLPEWLLNSLKIGAFGMHGSNKPLPHGRGRSPLNWALIQNKTLFFTYLFKYNCGVDDGPIVGMQKFDITPWDNCHTLHLKNTLSMIKLCEQYIPKILENSVMFQPQLDDGVSYYPKRTADDGVIYWNDSTINIYNLIRAVTSPFPGAFTFLNGDRSSKVIIWDGIPFDSRLEWGASSSGEILEVFYDKSFIIKTGDTTILVTKYEGIKLSKNNIGMFFSHSNIKRKEWIGLPT